MEIFAMRRYKLHLEKIHLFYIHLFLEGLPYARHCSRHDSYMSEQNNVAALWNWHPREGDRKKFI